jgi:hypothetical protein
MSARGCPIARPIGTRGIERLGLSNGVSASLSATTFAHAERAR